MLEFTLDNGRFVQLEHSLVSISKWESIFKIPYFSIETFSETQLFMYLDCMVLNGELTRSDISAIDSAVVNMIGNYINDTRSATFVKKSKEQSNITLTSEILYAYMTMGKVDWQAQHWHLNRLLKLLEVVSEFSKEPKKMSQQEIAEERLRLNKERRKKYQSKG